MQTIDLRSDTVTHPTPTMREAMYRAEVGDDVFGDDPTVIRLETLAAEKIGKEAALFVPSGTMGNLVSILSHCRRGDAVVVGDQAHCYYYEVGGAAVAGGIVYHAVPNREGLPDPADVEFAMHPENIHCAPTGLLCLENTHNRCGGVAFTADQMAPVIAVARRRGVPVHLDGARVFNAAVALNVDVKTITAGFDSVMFCLSKGLSAPVGSMVTGSADFVQRARRWRKLLGGGMRQAGILAAAGIVALTEMIDRLADDHANARRLAEGLANIPGIVIDPARVMTDIVIFEVERLPVNEFLGRLAAEGVKMVAFGGRKVRAVTHYGIEREDIEAALAAVSRVMTP